MSKAKKRSFQQAEDNPHSDEDYSDDDQHPDDTYSSIPEYDLDYTYDEYSEDQYEPPESYGKWKKCLSDDCIARFDREEPLRLQQVGSQYTVHTGKYPSSVVHLFAATECGAIVCVNVTGFLPYFLVKRADLMKHHGNEIAKYGEDCLERSIKEFLLKSLAWTPKQDRFKDVPWIHHIELVQRTDAKGFHGIEDFCKIVLHIPQFVPPIRRWFECGHNHGGIEITTYESDIPFTQRFIKDVALIPTSWFTIARYKKTQKPYTYCAAEVTCHYSDIIQLPLEGDNLKTAPIWITALDIETPTEDKVFPSAEKHPIACVSIVTCVYGEVNIRKAANADLQSGMRCAGSKKVPELDPATLATTGSIHTLLCAKMPGPKPNHEPTTVTRVNPIHRVILTTGSEEPLEDCTVLKYNNEIALLRGIRDFIVTINPPILEGFNHIDFDLPYIVNRAKACKVDKYVGRLSMLRNRICVARETTSGNKQTGQFKGKTVDIPGRVQLDIMRVCMKEKKYVSYSLNYISSKLLGLQKDDVPHDKMYSWFTSEAQEIQKQRRKTLEYIAHRDAEMIEIPPKKKTAVVMTHDQLEELRNGKPIETSRENKAAKVHRYCIKDSMLTMQNEEKLLVVDKIIQFSRILRVDLADVYGKGLTYQIVSQILHDAKQNEKINIQRYVLPVSLEKETRGLKGGYVAIPVVGFHKDPVIVLDFTSMYPSLMIAFNLCITTCLTRAQIERLRKDIDYREFEIEYEDGNKVLIREPVFFATESYRPGILPVILKKLLAERKVAQKDAKYWADVDSVLASIYNTIQLVLKIDANSIYGFTGAPTNPLCNRQISNLVTTLARHYIKFSAQYVIKHYPGSVQIYGDTDSIMMMVAKDGVIIDNLTVALEVGPKLAEEITAEIGISPVDIKFEKVYHPYVLLGKKRYGGRKYEAATKPPETQIAGLECTQRTMCDYARNIVEKGIKLLVEDNDQKGAVQYAKSEISRMLLGGVSMSELVVTKTVTKPIEEYTTRAVHVELAKRIKARDPSFRVSPNTRIPFVFVDRGKVKNFVEHKKNKKMEKKPIGTCDKSEDPLYVIEHGLPIDTAHYLEQLENPLSRLFAPLYADNSKNVAPRDPNEDPVVCKKCKGHIAKADIYKCPRCRAIKRAIDDLFHGEHARRKVVSTQTGTAGLLKYARKIPKCLGCGITIAHRTGGVCKDCDPRWNELHKDLEQIHRSLVEKVEVSRKRCEDCQGDKFEDITCHHIHCDNFYPSKERPKELAKYQEKLDQLSW